MATSLVVGLVAASLAVSVESGTGPALTVYNQDFGVVREIIPLELKAGINSVAFNGATVHLEPDSVILRDPAGQHALRIVEQSFRNDPISPGLLLARFEGQEIDFLVQRGDVQEIVRGKIVRSGYTPHYSAMNRYGQQYMMRQQAAAYGESSQPIIEVDGKLRFGLPGNPLFPELGDDSILKPTLYWQLETDAAAKLDAEIAYVTGGMSWEADYNLVAPEKGDRLDVIGWITVDNQSGKTFENARLKFVAGDVNKIQPNQPELARARSYAFAAQLDEAVQEKSFDEYHLYTIARPSTIRDRETKQIEFVRATGVQAERFYVYDGAKVGADWLYNNYREQPQYGTESNPKVWAMVQFENSEGNGLGVPLPAGRLRFYRQDSDGQLEFTGEDNIDHTPRNERVRVYTGNAFDIVGERRQTEYRIDGGRRKLDEAFEIWVRNRKETPTEVRVVEHLYRWSTWEITAKSDEFRKIDARTIEFRVEVPPDGGKVVTYTVHYEW